MKKAILSLLILCAAIVPNVSFAKGAPLFFQTGDELFEIEGAPQLEEGYSVGYACQHVGLFGADIWTWDCEIMAVNVEEFSAGNLDPEFKAEMEEKFSLSDRSRNPWNHYGVFGMALLLIGGAAVKLRSK
ncbi:hypothetical protein ACFOEK_09695 [Litoribrevibacter euphylliae]|uniref:Uncharacterized protein n=1 Tax=Litoribrevibacter euphylliae TaxID=1834034 RepID=A0ABV7HHY7_9GAMM